MDTFLLVIIACVLIGIFWALSKKGKEFKTVDMALFTPKADCTTIIPVPLNATTCAHNWDVVADHMLEVEHEKKQVTILSCRNCGLIDKTTQTTSPPPPPKPPVPPLPCKHEWQIQMEQTLEAGHEQKVVVVMTCRLCGEVDKTVEATSKPPASGKSECRHKWETEKKVELLSAYEQMLKSISVKDNYSSKAKVDPATKLTLDLNKAPAWMFRKTYVSLRICSLCGEIDKTITSNFELDENPKGDMSEVPEVAADEEEDAPVLSIKKQKKG